MSDNETRWKDRAEDPHILYCPECGWDGVCDGMGHETSTYGVHLADENVDKTIREVQYRHHCGMCNSEFLTIVSRKEVE